LRAREVLLSQRIAYHSALIPGTSADGDHRQHGKRRDRKIIIIWDFYCAQERRAHGSKSKNGRSRSDPFASCGHFQGFSRHEATDKCRSSARTVSEDAERDRYDGRCFEVTDHLAASRTIEVNDAFYCTLVIEHTDHHSKAGVGNAGGRVFLSPFQAAFFPVQPLSLRGISRGLARGDRELADDPRSSFSPRRAGA
jgi:hypothetical protein